MPQDVRTQIAVNTVWLQRMQCRKLAMLLLWLLSLGLCLYVAGMCLLLSLPHSSYVRPSLTL